MRGGERKRYGIPGIHATSVATISVMEGKVAECDVGLGQSTEPKMPLKFKIINK